MRSALEDISDENEIVELDLFDQKFGQLVKKVTCYSSLTDAGLSIQVAADVQFLIAVGLPEKFLSQLTHALNILRMSNTRNPANLFSIEDGENIVNGTVEVLAEETQTLAFTLSVLAKNGQPKLWLRFNESQLVSFVAVLSRSFDLSLKNSVMNWFFSTEG